MSKTVYDIICEPALTTRTIQPPVDAHCGKVHFLGIGSANKDITIVDMTAKMDDGFLNIMLPQDHGG